MKNLLFLAVLLPSVVKAATQMLATDLVTDGFVSEEAKAAVPWIVDGELFESSNLLMYRIPAMATNGKGEIVTVYDVRYGSGDLGNFRLSGVDLGENVSRDNGVTWTKPRLAVDVPNFRNPDGSWSIALTEDEKKDENTRRYRQRNRHSNLTREMDIGDAAMLYDPVKKRYWLLAITGGGLSTWGKNSIKSDCVLYTREEGVDSPWKPWTGGPEGNERSVRSALCASLGIKGSDKDGYAGVMAIFAGPGHGTVLRDGTLVFPMQYFPERGTPRCFAAYSTDNGATWQATQRVSIGGASQENCVMELDDGSWYMMCKGGSWGAGQGSRMFYRSTDRKTWELTHTHTNIIHVQGSCIRIGTGADGRSRYVLAHQIDPNQRAKLALIFGRDVTADGDKLGVKWDWEHPVMIHEGPTTSEGYNTMCMLDRDNDGTNDTLGLVYEAKHHIYFEHVDIRPYLK